jgi:hypothetical protein
MTAYSPKYSDPQQEAERLYGDHISGLTEDELTAHVDMRIRAAADAAGITISADELRAILAALAAAEPSITITEMKNLGLFP